MTVPGGQAAANGQDGSTGEVTVDTGSYTVNEVFTGGTLGSDYVSTLTCVDEAPVARARGCSEQHSRTRRRTWRNIKCTITDTHKRGRSSLRRRELGTAGNVDLFIKKDGVMFPVVRPPRTGRTDRRVK